MPELPDVPGLSFRHYAGPADHRALIQVYSECAPADDYVMTDTVEDYDREFSVRTDGDPRTDLLLAFRGGEPVGLAEPRASKDWKGVDVFAVETQVVPSLRGTPLRAELIRWAEGRAGEMAAAAGFSDGCQLQCFVPDKRVELLNAVEAAGYAVWRHGFSLSRPLAGDLPDFPFPPGTEARPVREEHYPKIVEAWNLATLDMRVIPHRDDAWFQAWKGSPTFDPSLWVMAWDGDELVGTVFNYIVEKDNIARNRKRGYVELISVKRAWRRRGIARAMISQSLRIHRDRGMEEAALGSDAESPSGALGLYQSLGFAITERVSFYRKPLVTSGSCACP